MTINDLWLAALTTALTEANKAKDYGSGSEALSWAHTASALVAMNEQPNWYAVSNMDAVPKAEG